MRNTFVEEARRRSHNIMGVEQHLQILMPSQRDGIPLPLFDYLALLKLLCTYAANLWAKYGARCRNYQKVLEIVEVMERREVEANAKDFSPMLCASIFVSSSGSSRTI